MLKPKYTKILAIMSGLTLTVTAGAQVLIGGFQGAGDPTDAGWTVGGQPITSPSSGCSFPAAGVGSYQYSLQVSNASAGFGNPTLQYQATGAGTLAFITNGWLTFTFSVPQEAAATSGYDQIYNLQFQFPNAGFGAGYTNWCAGGNIAGTWEVYSESESLSGEGNSNNGGATNGEPNFGIYYSSGGGLVGSETISVNISGLTNTINQNANGQYVNVIFQGNTGNGSEGIQDFNQVVLSQTAFGTAPSSVVYTVDDFSTNGVNPTNPPGDDYYAAAAYPYLDTTNIGIVWKGWFGNGITGFNFDPNLNVSGVTNANGSMAIDLTWNAATDGYQQWLIWHGNANTYVPTNSGGTVGISYPTYTNVECDVMFDPSSVTNANGDYGALRIGIRGVGDFNQSWLNTVTITDTNWHHLSAMLPSANPDSLNIADPIIGEDVTSGVGNGGLTGNQIVYVDNIKFTGPLAAPPLPPPTISTSPAKPGLRIWAGSTANTFDRSTITTTTESESWISPSAYPVTYSFSLLSYPNNNINQTMLQLIPVNTTTTTPLGGTYPGAGNQYFDYQNSNGVWLVLSPNGGGAVVAALWWKTNLPNANPFGASAAAAPTTTTNGYELAVLFTNSTAIGTWNLTFTSASAGTVTGPGNTPQAFTIADPNVSTDFANPLLAVFGFQPNSTAGHGLYQDWGFVEITNVSGGTIFDDWTKQSADFTSGVSPDNNFSAQGSANPESIIVVRTNLDALWVSWTAPAPLSGFGVVESTNLLTPLTSWIEPPFYSGNNDIIPPRGDSAVQLGPIFVTLLTTGQLPTASGNAQTSYPTLTEPLAPNAFFIGTTNYLYQY